mmetsp:Transcript_18872/g.37074  ORF Transcript_18872/g.37074 Transcript_18872/m.37074 type:complete len:1490 (-) Transcript_18872:78-4547(-)|eukprot:CAMPEP_0171486180 /NCGR_PEP_ID=MMETSP0958-20121227/950_1 /TAXON_ID=87120 /ORGANISM="Aurantiochytrium limacinum, Strain ATCCMYA-1381" /LENGTH=1489 /DNA_ID=CAMNT_0012019037 /DNA_START=675 /DNA_END=5144 /DNA_ORIENTATION=-
MDASELTKLENLCSLLYSGQQSSLIERLEAQRWLLRLQSSAQYLPQLEYTLENSSSPFALLYASKGLLLILTKDWRNVTSSQRIQLQRFLLQRLAHASTDPNDFVTKATIQVLCRLTKLGWVSDPELRGLMNEIVQFLQAGVQHAVLGLRILTDLITEFELGRTEPSGRLDPEGRQAAQAFREQDGLSRAFMLSLQTMNRAFNSQDPSRDRPVLKEALKTLQTCLGYDFVGTGYSESDDVVACLYIPIEWTKDIANAGALRLLFRIYNAQWQVQNESEIDPDEDGPASMALQCVALLASTRRSVFDESSRHEFLVALLEGSTQLMQEKTGLSHSEPCLHHLCRLLSRMKSHFQLVELAKPPQYQVWLEALASFTEGTLAAWRTVSTRSMHYLVRLWSALVLPTPYLRIREGLNRDGSSQPAYLRGLDQYVPRVVHAFVSTRADMCSAAALEELDDGGSSASELLGMHNQGFGSFGRGSGWIEDNPLDDEGMLLEQLTPLSTLARFRYGVSASGVAELFLNAVNERAQAVNALLSNPQGQNLLAAKARLADSQARLAFLTYVVGAIVGGHVTRVSARAIERLEELNAELAALVFKMVTDSQRTEDLIASRGESPAALIFGFGSNAGWRLELATLYFFRCFQTLYIESRAREDEAERPARDRSVELVEDYSGFMNFAFLRRGAMVPNGGGPAGNYGSMGMQGNDVRSMIQLRPLPAPSPSLDRLNQGGSSGSSGGSSTRAIADRPDADTGMSDGNADNNNNSGGSNNGASKQPLLVDELSAAELAKKERAINDEASQRASAMQNSIAARVGIQGGDRALLDVAMRRIFGLLQFAQHVNERSAQMDESSAPVMLVQRALSVLYQLSMGVTIVHTGKVHTPRLMSSGRLLLESEVIQDLLQNPSAERFPLLREPKHGRARTFLMATLSKLLYTQTRYPSSQNSSQVPENMFDVNANIYTSHDQVEERFVSFMMPMTDVADGLLRIVKSNPDELRSSTLRGPIIGLLRDLRGVISSATAAREFELIFSWFYPNRIKLLAVIARVFNYSFDVMVPLLKLLSELVHNRGSRIVFPSLSAGGLILFREAALVLVAFCQPQLQALERTREEQRARHEKREAIKSKLVDNMNNPVMETLSQALGPEISNSANNDPLSMQALHEAVLAMGEEFLHSSTDGEKKKAENMNGTVIDVGPGAVGPGVTVDLEEAQQKCSRVCLITLSRMLNGRYAPLGTFQLFGDTCLLDARRATLELALSSSPKHTMSFPKMSKALISLLNQLAEKFVISLVDLSSSLFARIMCCLGEAIVSGNAQLSSPAASAVEAIAIFRCRAAAAVHGPNSDDANSSDADVDPLRRVRAVLNPEHRSRGDTTSLEEYHRAALLFQEHERAHPNLFSSLLAVVMDQLFSSGSSELPNQWSMAKPIMPLIFCAPAEFERQRQQFLSQQSAAREPRIREAYDSLFTKLGPALSNPALFNVVLRSNDTFAKELCTFNRELRRE